MPGLLLDTEECIGCESCVEVCPEAFAMDSATGKAMVTDPESLAPTVALALDVCPVQAITLGEEI